MRDALDGLALALASGNLQTVLAAEYPLAEAVRHLPRRGASIDAADRAQLRPLIEDAFRILSRCRQLGEAARDVVAAALPALQGYGRTGAMVAPRLRTTIDSRS